MCAQSQHTGQCGQFAVSLAENACELVECEGREQDGVLNGKVRVFVLFGRLLHNQFKASRYK